MSAPDYVVSEEDLQGIIFDCDGKISRPSPRKNPALIPRSSMSRNSDRHGAEKHKNLKA
jgi:hypothetical protein